MFASSLRLLVLVCSLLRHAQLGLERLWHGGGRGAGQAQLHLHAVVDEPLQRGQGSDHDDPGTQASPHALEHEV